MKYEKGMVEVIVGPMFSGKTTELLLRCNHARHEYRCLIFKPRIDTRCSLNKVVAHGESGQQATCITVARPNDILEFVTYAITVVAIDEAQFFDNPEELAEVAHALARCGKRVIIAGLDLDKWRIPFAWVDALGQRVSRTTLVAQCACGAPARFSQYLPDTYSSLGGGKRIDVGGAEKYEPRCDKCYQVMEQGQGMKKIQLQKVLVGKARW
jgi:thymidine kinase